MSHDRQYRLAKKSTREGDATPPAASQPHGGRAPEVPADRGHAMPNEGSAGGKGKLPMACYRLLNALDVVGLVLPPTPVSISELIASGVYSDDAAFLCRAKGHVQSSRNDGEDLLTLTHKGAVVLAKFRLRNPAAVKRAGGANGAKAMPDPDAGVDDGSGAKQASPPATAGTGHTPSALASALGFNSTATVNAYAKKVGITTPRRGQRNFIYPSADVVELCRYMSTAYPDQKIRTKAKQLLEMLAKIER